MTTNLASHDEARVSLEAAAIGALSPREHEAVLAHVATCPECGPELEAWRETIGAVSFAATPRAMSPDRARAVRQRLVSRALADRGAAFTSPAPSPRVSHLPRLALAWALAAGLVLAIGLVSLLQTRQRVRSLQDALTAERQRTAAQIAATDSLRRALDEQLKLVAAVTGADVAVVEMTSAGARAPSARMYWDRKANAWTFVAHNMPPVAAGRTYQLWLVTKTSEKISAGTFIPGADGEAVVRATYALARDSLAAVAVTEEPRGGVPQPTGSMVISGAPR